MKCTDCDELCVKCTDCDEQRVKCTDCDESQNCLPRALTVGLLELRFDRICILRREAPDARDSRRIRRQAAPCGQVLCLRHHIVGLQNRLMEGTESACSEDMLLEAQCHVAVEQTEAHRLESARHKAYFSRHKVVWPQNRLMPTDPVFSRKILLWMNDTLGLKDGLMPTQEKISVAIHSETAKTIKKEVDFQLGVTEHDKLETA